MSDSISFKRARQLHDQIPLIDGHNDLPWQYRKIVDRAVSRVDLSENQPDLHTDIPRLRQGGVGGQFWSVFVSQALPKSDYVRATMEQIDVVYNILGKYPETFQLALTADDVEQAFSSNKIASMIGIEGGHSIDNSLGALRMFYMLGARYMTLTHFDNVDWADSCTDEPVAGGLTEFGREVVREMNRLGMLVDLSHVHADTMRDTLDTTDVPVVFSHSSARALTSHPRNVPDDVLGRVKNNDGIVMVSFVPQFVSQKVFDHSLAREAEKARLEAQEAVIDEAVDAGIQAWDIDNPEPRATLSDIADHIDHIREKTSVDHIGIGSDYDGITTVPEGLEDVSKYPALTAELLRREYSEEDILKILGGNVLRVMRAVESDANKIQKERGPSESLIEVIDGK